MNPISDGVKVFKTRRAFYILPVLFSDKSVVPPRQAPSGRPREFDRPLAGMVNKGSSTSAVWMHRVIRGRCKWETSAAEKKESMMVT
jgi:hypothetical protein